MEVVEIDHTPLDILLTDDDGKWITNRAGQGRAKTHRAWLTVAICTASRIILGWHISRDAPSWVSVMCCLRMSLMRKDMAEYGCDTEHPAFGVPTILKLDNGLEFHSNSLKAAAAQLNTELRWMPRKKPNYKGTVERFIGTVSRDFLAHLAGRTFRDVRDRGDYPSEKRAAFTLSDIQRFFGRWVGDVYHNKPHFGLGGRTPLHCWEDLSGFGVNLPPVVEDLHAILALTIERTVTREGVSFLGLKYQSHELQTMHRRKGHLGKQYMVKVDPLDIGQVLVMDETDGRWLAVPALHPELSEGVSLAEWRETVELGRKRTDRHNRVALETLRKARRELAEEADRKGRKPIRMKPEEVDWYRGHVDDPFWDLTSRPGEDDEDFQRDEHRRRRGRKGRARMTDDQTSRRVGTLPASRPANSHPDDDEGDGELTAIID